MTSLTIRDIPEELLKTLREAKERRGESINQIVIRTLMKSFAVKPMGRDLEKYTTWSEEDQEEFMRALSDQRQVDDDLWK